MLRHLLAQHQYIAIYEPLRLATNTGELDSNNKEDNFPDSKLVKLIDGVRNHLLLVSKSGLDLTHVEDETGYHHFVPPGPGQLTSTQLDAIASEVAPTSTTPFSKFEILEPHNVIFNGFDLKAAFALSSKREIFESPEAMLTSFEKWKKAAISNVKRGGITVGLTQIGKGAEGHFVRGILLEDGILTYEIRSVNKHSRKIAGHRVGLSEENASSLFSRMMVRYGDNVKAIRAEWHGDNPHFIDNFFSFRNGGSTPEAASNTRSQERWQMPLGLVQSQSLKLIRASTYKSSSKSRKMDNNLHISCQHLSAVNQL